MENRQISSERKTVYYVGVVISVLGFLTFGSVFLSGALHFGDFSDFEARARSMALRAVFGMAMMIGGFLLQGVGRLGAAGSGMKLDPEQARRDIEPWSRMSGGVLKDTLDEAGIRLGQKAGPESLPFDERLRRLQGLLQQGLISQQEYDETKKRILESAAQA
jgi:hypothetical protein